MASPSSTTFSSAARNPKFVAFDIPYLDDRDVRDRPLLDRKALFRAILPEGRPVVYASHLEGRGSDLFAAVCQRDLEGIVAKGKPGT